MIAGVQVGWSILEINGEKQCDQIAITNAIKNTNDFGKPTIITFQPNSNINVNEKMCNSNVHNDKNSETQKEKYDEFKKQKKLKGKKYNN